MHAMPIQKYRAFQPIPLPDRQWPSRTIESAPYWCSVDLRDGNQALIKALAARAGQAEWVFEHWAESVTGTELEVALEICEAVKDVIQPTRANRLILSLPATVEMATPNTYADMFEWFGRKISNRETVIL